MNWFKGNIAEAVTLSKRKNAVFVVFVAGTDELSTNLATLIDTDTIRKHLESDRFVAIRIESGSETYQQFAQIYQLVPLPSIFFIGQNGTPLDVVTSLTSNVGDLEEKINGVLSLVPAPSGSGTSGAKLAPTEAPSISLSSSVEKAAAEAKVEQGSGSSNVVCEDGVCRRVEPPPAAADPQNDEKVARAKELIEKKRKEKEAEEARQEREKELQRRRQGQDVAALKKWQEDQELKQLKEDRKREKKEAEEAKKKILEQIEQDKRERAQKFAPIPPKSPPQAAEQQNHSPAAASDTSRIQFKTPSGGTEIHVFASTDHFSTVRSYVQQEILSGSGISDFALATTFPRREFSEEHMMQTLTELSLTPSAVLLIIPLGRGNTGGSVRSSTQVASTSPGSTAFHFFTSLIWSFVSPVMSVLSYFRNWMFPRPDQGQQKRAAEDEIPDHDAAKRRNLQFPGDGRDAPQPSTSKSGEAAYRRLGSSNIHRLHDRKDSDDENNTWNGNSTQQM